MNKVKTLLALSLALVMTFALCACSAEIGGTEETWEYSAENREDSLELFNNFFEQTFGETNQVVTVTTDDAEVSVETIDGTSDCATYAQTGATVWSFIQDDEYIYAMSYDGYSYYTVSEEYYNSGYFAYKNSFDIFEELDDAEGLTWSCAVTGNSKDGENTSTLVLVIDSGDDGSIKIEAAATNDLVENITISNTSEGASAITNMTITYGSASVTLPDISGWSKEEF